MARASVVAILGMLAILVIASCVHGHMTGLCVSRLPNGNLSLTVQHWHSGTPFPDTATMYFMDGATASSSGRFDTAVGGCGALCPMQCTEFRSCNPTQSTQGAWRVEINDVPQRFVPGETVLVQILGGEATMAPTGTCNSVGDGYGPTEGSSQFVEIPPAVTTCFAEICGDGFISPPAEDCDSADLNGQTCELLGYDGGALACGTCCTYDTSGCFFCDDSPNTPTISGCPTGVIDLPTDPGVCCGTDSYTITASDADEGLSNCGTPTLTRVGGASDSCFADGASVTWTATDGAGQTDSCSWSYRVHDREAPVFNECPTGVDVFLGAPVGYGAISATDNCAVTALVQTSGPAPGTVLSSPGNYTIWYEAVDAAGLRSLCSFVLTAHSVVVQVYQDDMAIARVATDQRLRLYMYMPITVLYGDNHQAAYGNTSDGSVDFIQLRNSTSVVYQSPDGWPNQPLEAHAQTFSQFTHVVPDFGYSLWACMNPGGCFEIYDDVVVCASEFTDAPLGGDCVLSPL